jgi:predicted nucleic acid-binding protein
MILIDANILIYAHVPTLPHHEAARRWLEEQLNESRVGLPWPSLLAFMRLVTNPRIFERLRLSRKPGAVSKNGWPCPPYGFLNPLRGTLKSWESFCAR